MNVNEKNVSMDQQQPVTQKTASQNEDLSPPDETMITSSLQAGINYCRYTAEQMLEEIKNVQEKWDSTRQTNRVLKQNFVNLENEKQRLIANFQEEFRKFNSLNGCVKELEEEILGLKELLDASMKLEDHISQSKIEELKIRTTIQASLEEQETELEKIESSVLDLIKEAEEEIGKAEVFIAEQEIFINTDNQLKSLIHHIDMKITDLNSTKDFTQDTEEIKRIINSLQEECITQVTSVQTKLTEIPMQVKMETDILHFWYVFQKDKIKSEFSAKQNIVQDLKIKTATKLDQFGKLDREIKAEEFAIQNLENEKKLIQIEHHHFEGKLQALEQEKTEVEEALSGLWQTIQFLKEEKSSLTEEQENLQAIIKQLKIEKETVEKNLEVLKDRTDLNKKLTVIRSSKDLSKVENERLGNEKQQLLAEKENLEKENVDLILEILTKKQHISELQEILQKNKVLQISANEEEFELLDQLRLIKMEEYSLTELKEMELDEVVDKFKQIFSTVTDLESLLTQVHFDNGRSEEEIRSKQKMLKIIAQDNEFLKSSIQRIKQNVYNGTFITMQELNKRYNIMVNGKNVETERVHKLQQEIVNLKARLNSKKECVRHGESDSFASQSDFLSKAKKSKK